MRFKAFCTVFILVMIFGCNTIQPVQSRGTASEETTSLSDTDQYPNFALALDGNNEFCLSASEFKVQEASFETQGEKDGWRDFYTKNKDELDYVKNRIKALSKVKSRTRTVITRKKYRRDPAATIEQSGTEKTGGFSKIRDKWASRTVCYSEKEYQKKMTEAHGKGFKLGQKRHLRHYEETLRGIKKWEKRIENIPEKVIYK